LKKGACPFRSRMSVRNALRAALFLLVLAGPAWAFQPFVVRDIRVEGIQRIEAGTVFSYLPVKVGDTMTDEKAAARSAPCLRRGSFGTSDSMSRERADRDSRGASGHRFDRFRRDEGIRKGQGRARAVEAPSESRTSRSSPCLLDLVLFRIPSSRRNRSKRWPGRSSRVTISTFPWTSSLTSRKNPVANRERIAPAAFRRSSCRRL